MLLGGLRLGIESCNFEDSEKAEGGKVVGEAARDLLLNSGIYQKIYHGMVMLFHDFHPSYIMSLLTEFCLISGTIGNDIARYKK